MRAKEIIPVGGHSCWAPILGPVVEIQFRKLILYNLHLLEVTITARVEEEQQSKTEGHHQEGVLVLKIDLLVNIRNNC